MKQDPVQVQTEKEHIAPMGRNLGRGWKGKIPVGELAFDNPVNGQYLVCNVHLLHAKHPCILFNSSSFKTVLNN